MRNVKNGGLCLGGDTMDYIRFGSGTRTLVILPGVGDGLKTVKGTAAAFALMYRRLAREFSVYMFSRRSDLPEQYSTREMAEDQARAMALLGLKKAVVLGVSQGGMIAQWLAIDHPELVERLILTVTLARPNDTIRTAIAAWTEQAKRGDYRGIMLDNAERSYTPARLRLMRPMYAALGSVGKPKSFRRFLTQAEACVTHDAWERLPEIRCPTLVIGGTEDKIASAEASRELAARIPGAQLVMLEGLGHGLYEEDPRFLERVAEFGGRA
ncbi:MAG: alpha/beta hydrolase [Oscillospiraceae bacterium]|nr:alpha/beta hydrolase [Oscillospiraceae bacterium]